MFKRLNRRSFRLIRPGIHAFLDYAASALLLILPFVFGLSGKAGSLSLLLGFIHIIFSFFTNYPGGVVKVLTFPFHGWMEFAESILLIFLPWLGGFSDAGGAGTYYLIFGLFILTLWMLTDYRTKTADEYEIN